MGDTHLHGTSAYKISKSSLVPNGADNQVEIATLSICSSYSDPIYSLHVLNTHTYTHFGMVTDGVCSVHVYYEFTYDGSTGIIMR